MQLNNEKIESFFPFYVENWAQKSQKNEFTPDFEKVFWSETVISAGEV